ncbi:leukocyte receptor cluster member 9 isoform 1-T2 [Anomaloglossus baeobatrachus]|uniref:leukocyte receptor cluster member 9 n=1 Tax=Anomaloglossus baeobatrachus TaxID=238106 RepID=UPI003F50937C
MESTDNDGDTMKESIKVDDEVNMEGAASQNEEETTIEEAEVTPDDTICQFFLSGRCRFGDKCRNRHVGVPSASNDSHGAKDKGKSNQASKPKGKKPPMKTASDVISRIQWDTHLPKEHFIVGYLDRFLGTIEKPFSAFCWEDLASLGVDVLAIPKHRIQYFKYHKLVVWDKVSRVDNIFGSTGSGMTILDIIDRYESMMQTERNSAEDQSAEAQGDVTTHEVEELEEKHCATVDQADTKKLRPTHFIAMRISSEDVKSSVKEVQNVLQKHSADVAEFCIPLPELHLTLCLLHLESSEDIEVAYTVLEELKSDMQRLLPPSLILSFEGLKDFHSRVLYLEPVPIPGFGSFVSRLNQSFRSKGLKIIDPPQANTFHLTIAKMPRNVAIRNPSLLFRPEVYRTVNLAHFGAQNIDCLSFCYAGSSRRTDGFYTTLLELPLY